MELLWNNKKRNLGNQICFHRAEPASDRVWLSVAPGTAVPQALGVLPWVPHRSTTSCGNNPRYPLWDSQGEQPDLQWTRDSFTFARDRGLVSVVPALFCCWGSLFAALWLRKLPSPSWSSLSRNNFFFFIFFNRKEPLGSICHSSLTLSQSLFILLSPVLPGHCSS